MMKMKKEAWITLLLMTDSIKKKRYVYMYVCMLIRVELFFSAMCHTVTRPAASAECVYV